MIREEEENKLRRDNDTVINNQIESVSQLATIKVKKAQEVISKLKSQGLAEEESIVRLHRGRIRNFRVSAEEKVQSLENKRAVSVGFDLICGGVVEIA
ncbi:hypothetical protein ACFLV5_03285 [Chloroflexota bacterium]